MTTGAVLGNNLQALIFVNLFWGCVAGVGVSWLIHRTLHLKNEKKQEPLQHGVRSEEKGAK